MKLKLYGNNFVSTFSWKEIKRWFSGNVQLGGLWSVPDWRSRQGIRQSKFCYLLRIPQLVKERTLVRRVHICILIRNRNIYDAPHVQPNRYVTNFPYENYYQERTWRVGIVEVQPYWNVFECLLLTIVDQIAPQVKFVNIGKTANLRHQ